MQASQALCLERSLSTTHAKQSPILESMLLEARAAAHGSDLEPDFAENNAETIIPAPCPSCCPSSLP